VTYEIKNRAKISLSQTRNIEVEPLVIVVSSPARLYKKLFDKRQSIKEREGKREISRKMKEGR